jgi:hypothetical protein
MTMNMTTNTHQLRPLLPSLYIIVFEDTSPDTKPIDPKAATTRPPPYLAVGSPDDHDIHQSSSPPSALMIQILWPLRYGKEASCGRSHSRREFTVHRSSSLKRKRTRLSRRW